MVPWQGVGQGHINVCRQNKLFAVEGIGELYPNHSGRETTRNIKIYIPTYVHYFYL